MLKVKYMDSFFFILVLVLTSFVPLETFTIIMFVSTIYFASGKINISKDVLKYIIVPFSLLFITGAIGIFKYDSRDILRDMLYFTNPILQIAFGLSYAQKYNDFKFVLKNFVITGAIVSTIHIIQFLITPDVFNMSYLVIRETVGRGHFISLLALVFVLKMPKYGIYDLTFKNKPLIYLFVMITCASSLVLSFSRSSWIVTILLFLILSKWNKKLTIAVSPILVVIVVGILMNLNIFSGVDSDSFIFKFQKSYSEIVGSNFETDKDINEYWRGYEAHRAIELYKNGDWGEYIFGKGFGVLVPLDYAVKLDNKLFTEIPHLHNGYMYVLVKTGALGVVLYLMFSFFIIKHGYNLHRNGLSLKGKILTAIGLVNIVTTTTTTGVFNKNQMVIFVVMIGCLVSKYKEDLAVKIPTK